MRRLFLTCLLAVFVLAVAATPISAVSSPQTVATGSFTLRGDRGTGENRAFAFTVQQSSDGTVTGQMQIRTFGGNLIHGAVNCFAQDGNQAIVGGTITAFHQAPELIGAPFAFAIQDNPDVSTFVLVDEDFGESPCTGLLEVTGEPDLDSLLDNQGIPITTGNILIH